MAYNTTVLFYLSLPWVKNSSRSLLADSSVPSGLSGSFSALFRGEMGLLGGVFCLNSYIWWRGLVGRAGKDFLSKWLWNGCFVFKVRKSVRPENNSKKDSPNPVSSGSIPEMAFGSQQRTSSCPKSIGLLKQSSRNLICYFTYLILGPLKQLAWRRKNSL